MPNLRPQLAVQHVFARSAGFVPTAGWGGRFQIHDRLQHWKFTIRDLPPAPSWSWAARRVFATILCCAVLTFPSVAAQQSGEDTPLPLQTVDGKLEQPGKVDVKPVARDDQIRQRIADILETTGWFGEPGVSVQKGIVFLKGTTELDEYRQWAGDLAKNTEGVVAVVNQIEVDPTTVWNFEPTFQVLNELARGFLRLLPLIVVALVVVALSWVFARLAVNVLRRGLMGRALSHLLREVMARAGGMLVMLAGLYLVLRISGLTQLALTLMGGTGLIGLVLGIAFRDITENFLASLFLSLQQPFREGDLVEVTGVTGYVQRLTSRTTVLMTLDGNQTQIPNSTVFKSTIRNFTSNPNRREDFIVGIGYDDSITYAQEVARKVLAAHPAVQDDPEPLVLVETSGVHGESARLLLARWRAAQRAESEIVRHSARQTGLPEIGNLDAGRSARSHLPSWGACTHDGQPGGCGISRTGSEEAGRRTRNRRDQSGSQPAERSQGNQGTGEQIVDPWRESPDSIVVGGEQLRARGEARKVGLKSVREWMRSACREARADEWVLCWNGTILRTG
jgi:small-conductance mechanosensitive channel